MVTMFRELERGLIEAGVPAERATAIAEALETRFAEVATKEDLDQVATVLRRELEVLRNEMHLEMRVRFEAVDERFDSLRREMEARFTQVDQRLGDIVDRLAILEEKFLRLMAMQIGVITALVAGLIAALIYAIVA